MNKYIKGLSVSIMLILIHGCASALTAGMPAIEPSKTLPNGVKSDISGSSTSISDNKVPAIVTSVIDGDTIEVNIQGKVCRLRYIGIDAPESNVIDIYTRNLDLSSTDKNRELVHGKLVELEKDISDQDEYGRLLRYVYANGMFVNAELVKSGYAQSSPCPPDMKYIDLFETLQFEAKAANRGIWGSSTTSPVPKSSAKGLYVGSKNSDKYHFPTCIWAQKISVGNEIWFNSKEEAQTRGYIPCKVCRPPL